MLEQQEYIGTYIGGYLLTGQLSTSSSSYTFLGETASLTDRQHVVIKWYHAVHLTTQQEKKNFLRKASTLKHLQQSFILPILATGLFIDTPYVVTPYMSKGSLYDHMHNPANQAWLQEHVITIIKQISQALAYSHQQNVAHGKLHPGNILFNERDEVQLTDFQLVSFPTTLVETASIRVNREGEQELESRPGRATQDYDHHALGNIAHELFIGCTSPTNQTSSIFSNLQKTTLPIADEESNLTSVSYAEEACAPEPPQHLSDISTISTSLSALDIPTEKRSSIAISAAETLPVLAVEASSASANKPSIQADAPTITSCINTHTSMETPTLPPTPPPPVRGAKRGTSKNLLVPLSQQNGIRGDIIRRFLRDQGSLFLISGILCIIIFSIIGTQFSTALHTYSLKGQRALLLDSTAVKLPTPKPTSSERTSTSRPIHELTPRDLFLYTTASAIGRHAQSIPRSTGISSQD